MKTLLGAMVFATALLMLGPAASAQKGFDDGRWYVSPMATWVFREDKDRITNDGFGAHFGLGRGFGDNWAVELNLVGNQLDGIDEVNQWGVGLDLIRSGRDLLADTTNELGLRRRQQVEASLRALAGGLQLQARGSEAARVEALLAEPLR